jgi:hypothetical protein
MKLSEDFSLKKYNAILKLVTLEDAAFILSLRTNTNLNKYLSIVTNDLEQQIKWLKQYKERELKGEEYYFLVGDETENFYGTTRLYHFENEKFVTGSWIFGSDTPFGLAIKGDIIGREIAFENFGFTTCLFDVRKDNAKVLKYHKGFFPDLIGEDELNFYFELSKENFYTHKNKLLKLLGYGT